MTGIVLKECVDIAAAKPQLLLGLMVLDAIFRDHGVPLFVTSVCDGKHHQGSVHPLGWAADIRSLTRYSLPASVDELVAEEGRAALGPAFDFFVENAGTDNVHFHLEWDPYRAGVLKRPPPEVATAPATPGTLRPEGGQS